MTSCESKNSSNQAEYDGQGPSMDKEYFSKLNPFSKQNPSSISHKRGLKVVMQYTKVV